MPYSFPFFSCRRLDVTRTNRERIQSSALAKLILDRDHRLIASALAPAKRILGCKDGELSRPVRNHKPHARSRARTFRTDGSSFSACVQGLNDTAAIELKRAALTITYFGGRINPECRVDSRPYI
jgi:hypothetical protein